MGGGVFLHQPRRTWGPISSPTAPSRSQHPLSPGNFPPLPLKTQTGGSTTLAYLCLCRLQMNASPSAPPAPLALGQGSFMTFPLKASATFGENCPHPHSAFPVLHTIPNPLEISSRHFVCLSSKEVISSAHSEHVISCEMPRNSGHTQPQLRGPGELRTGQEDAGHPPLLFVAPTHPSPRNKQVIPNLTKSLEETFAEQASSRITMHCSFP